jgi:C_GCAxxG_C_C family probable redox protein
MPVDSGTSRARTIIPLIDADADTAKRLRRRSLENLSCMGHCAPAVMQTLLDASGIDAPSLVRASGGLPGGIGNIGEECGAVTAPLMLLGLRHAHDPLDRGLPLVAYKGHELLRRFTECHGTIRCREIRGHDRLPLKCAGVVRRAAEPYVQTIARDATKAIPEESRQAFSRLYTYFVEHRFHCAQTVLVQLQSSIRVDEMLRDAVAGFMGGTVFTGQTCSALTAGIAAMSAALGTVERSRLRVLRMIGLMAVGGDAFADKYNEFNKTMNRGQRLARWFEKEFGATRCRTLTRCDFSTAQGVTQYIENGTIQHCRTLAVRVAQEVERLIEQARTADFTADIGIDRH